MRPSPIHYTSITLGGKKWYTENNNNHIEHIENIFELNQNNGAFFWKIGINNRY